MFKKQNLGIEARFRPARALLGMIFRCGVFWRARHVPQSSFGTWKYSDAVRRFAPLPRTVYLVLKGKFNTTVYFEWFSSIFIDFYKLLSTYLAFISDEFAWFYCFFVFFQHCNQCNIAIQILEIEKSKKCVFSVLPNKSRWSSHGKSRTFLDFVSSVTRKQPFFQKWFTPNRLAQRSPNSSKNTRFPLFDFFDFFWSFWMKSGC